VGSIPEAPLVVTAPLAEQYSAAEARLSIEAAIQHLRHGLANRQPLDQAIRSAIANLERAERFLS